MEVMEHISVGGIRFCRKGLIEKWPPRDAECMGYDLIHSDALRDVGYRVGYLQHVRMEHLGEGKTELWRQPVSAS